jgi:hypothetical protein
MSAVAASAASAKDQGTHTGLFTANVGAGETVQIHAEQIGTIALTTTGTPPTTCTTVKFTGKALTLGPSSTDITLEPTFEGCHTVLTGLTKAVTFTVTGCAFKFDAKATTTENTPGGLSIDRTSPMTIECPQGKQIEIHHYNTAIPPHNSVLCTYDIGPQGPLSGIELTNKINTPTSANDIEGHLNVTGIAVHNTLPSAVCGQMTNPTATLAGTLTIRATNASSVFVDMSISDFF